MIRLTKNRRSPGIAFGDSIKTEHIRNNRRNFSSSDGFGNRGFLLPLLIVFCGVVLFLKLFDLQIIHGNYYRTISDNNRTKTEIIHAPRGVIFDRNTIPLVFNVPGFRQTKNGKTVLISHENALSLLAKKIPLEVDSLREYPFKDATSHIVGYIGQVSEDELKHEYSSYKAGDIIGKMGIEKTYESKLKGVDGRRLIEVDNIGKPIRTLGETNPISGQNIVLTIDVNFQKNVSLAMKDVKKGAAIVSTPTGEILALDSKPSFDPNLFTMDTDYKAASDSAYKSVEEVLLDDKNQPLLNRVVSGVYPPGSTFKIVTAAVGLEDKIFDEGFTIEDTGILRIGEFSFANWYFTQYGRTEGSVNVVKALTRSNDIFFYKAAEKIGIDTLSKGASQFGVGKNLGIDLPEETSGLLPTTQWKETVMKDKWYLGDTYHYGIGQGFLLTTPLQVNTWTQVISNGGTLYEPHLLKNQKSKIKNQKFLSDNTVSLIRQGMIGSCSPGGVAWPLFNFSVKNSNLKVDGKNITDTTVVSGLASSSAQLGQYKTVSIACKTGTAQHGGEQTLPHAWITLFAPAYNPQIVVTVLVEESGEGSNIAAPIAKKILESWFTQ